MPYANHGRDSAARLAAPRRRATALGIMPYELAGPSCSLTVRRAGLHYREGDRTVFVDGEMLAAGEFDFVIYTSSICAWEESREPISDAERERIIANIQAAFRQDG